jgi:N-acetylmuramoyl-L-alanine amidase-like protein
MNNPYEQEGPGLDQLFAEAEMESEFRRGGSARARRTDVRRPVALRRPAVAPKPRAPFRRQKPRIRIWPRGTKFPILFPIPPVLHPSLWPGLFRPPFEPPGQPGQPQRPDTGRPFPPPSMSSGAPPPADARAIEPPDNGDTPPDTAALSDTDTTVTTATDAAEPSEELLQFFSAYQIPQGEFGMQPEYESWGRNGRHGSGSKACRCVHTRSTPPSMLGLEALDTEFEAARYSEPDEFNYEFEVVKPASPLLSPLATAKFGLRRGSKRSIPVFGVCVHTTGGGPANKAKKDPRRSALQRSLDYYLKGSGGFPHYVVAYDGSIIAICDERQIAWHAGFGKKEYQYYKTWTAPRWWSSVWNPKGARSPLDLFPKGGRSGNSGHIGVEMLADTTGYGFTNAQYEALAKLVKDIARRHKLPIASAPSARLLGHEDVHPLGRQNKGGGWDPGAHRDKPRFSWSRLWSLVKANP